MIIENISNKYVCVSNEDVDNPILADYRNKGYKIIKLINGNADIRDSIKTIANNYLNRMA